MMEVLFAHGAMQHLPDGTWVAVHRKAGVVGTAATRRALLKLPAVVKIEVDEDDDVAIVSLRSIPCAKVSHGALIAHGRRRGVCAEITAILHSDRPPAYAFVMPVTLEFGIFSYADPTSTEFGRYGL